MMNGSKKNKPNVEARTEQRLEKSLMKTKEQEFEQMV